MCVLLICWEFLTRGKFYVCRYFQVRPGFLIIFWICFNQDFWEQWLIITQKPKKVEIKFLFSHRLSQFSKFHCVSEKKNEFGKNWLFYLFQCPSYEFRDDGIRANLTSHAEICGQFTNSWSSTVFQTYILTGKSNYISISTI